VNNFENLKSLFLTWLAKVQLKNKKELTSIRTYRHQFFPGVFYRIDEKALATPSRLRRVVCPVEWINSWNKVAGG